MSTRLEIALILVIREMDTVEKVIQRATRKSRDGRIDLSDFLNEAADSMRYGIFTPLEAAIIFHFASRGMIGSNNRLAEQDFRALLDAKWEPPNAYEGGDGEATSTHWLSNLGASAWNFTLGGIAGALGAFAVCEPGPPAPPLALLFLRGRADYSSPYRPHKDALAKSTKYPCRGATVQGTVRLCKEDLCQ